MAEFSFEDAIGSQPSTGGEAKKEFSFEDATAAPKKEFSFEESLQTAPTTPAPVAVSPLSNNAPVGLMDYPMEAGKRLLMPFPEQIIADPLRAMGVAASAGGQQVENRDLATETARAGEGPESVVPPQSFSYPQATDVRESKLYQAGEAVSEWSKEMFAPRNDVLNPVVADVLSGFGSLAANIAQASIPVVGPVSLAATAPMQGISEAAQAAVKFGATPEQQVRAGQLGSISGATEFVDAMLPGLGTPGRVAQFLGKVGAKVAVGVFVEGGQEGVQKLIQNAIAKGIYNPNQSLTEDVAYNTLIGAIVGGTAKPMMDGSLPATKPTSADVNAAHSTLVGTPIPTADPAATAKEAPVLTPFEEMLATAPTNSPTVQHFKDSSPLSSDVDVAPAMIAPQHITPPSSNPVREKALQSGPDVEAALQAIYEVLGKPDQEIDPATLNQTGPQLGSNKGGVYSDMEGNNYYIKEAQSPEHLTNEKVAAELYKLAGANILEYVPAKNSIATKLVTLDKKAASELSAIELAQARSDFVIHAWLGNWDAVGLGGDNLGAVKGKPIWLDLGGALEFRAKGAPKGDAFGIQVGELSSLLDYKVNPDAAALFSKLSKNDVDAAASKVVKLSDASIRAAVKKGGGSDALAEKLIARRDNIAMQLDLPNVIAPSSKQLDKDIELLDFVLGTTPDPKKVETHPNEWLDASIEVGESVKVQEEVDDSPSMIKSISVGKPDQLIPLDTPGMTKLEIVAHNKKVSAEQKKKNKGFYYPQRVNMLAKKWKLYHGTHNGEFEKFNNPLDKVSEKGIFFSPSLSFAKAFAGGHTVYEVKVTPGKTKSFDLAKAGATKEFMDKVAYHHAKRVHAKGTPETDFYFQQTMKSRRQDLEFTRKEMTSKFAKAAEERKAFYAKYGVPKLLPQPKTGFDWGGIHAAIEEARAEGYDTLVLRNINEGGGHDQIVVLSPNRVFNTKTKKMMFSLSQGGQRYNIDNLTPAASQQREQLIGTVEALLQRWKKNYDNAVLSRAAVAQVAGPQVAARTITPTTISNKGVDVQGWGDNVPDESAGYYVPMAERDMALPLIAVSVGGSSQRAVVTAYHESWHAIEGTLTPDEIATLRAETEALREFIIARNSADAALYRAAEQEEVWAEAAAYYSYDQTMRRTKIYQGPAEQVFQKIIQMLDAIRAAVRNLGFERSGDIFEAFYRGEMASRREGMPTDMLERWWAREAGGEQQLASLHSELEAATAENVRSLSAIDPGITHVPAQAENLAARRVVKKLYSMAGGPGVVPPPVQQAMAHADQMAKRHKWMWGLDRLVDLNMKFTPLVAYAGLIRQARVDATNWHDAGSRIMKAWRKLGKQSENLAALIDDVTHMVYRTPQEIKNGVGRQPTPAEFQTLVAKHGVSTEALDVFKRQKMFFEIFLKQSNQLAIDEAKRTISDPVALMNAIVAIQTREATMLARPYFPFLRYGRHFVTIKDAKGTTVFFETFERQGLKSAEMQQMAAKKELTKKLQPGEQIFHGTLPESAAPFIGLPPELLAGIQKELMSLPNAAGQVPGLTPEQLTAIEQLRFDLSPSASFAHRFQKKDYTKGYSEDFLRSFSRYAFQAGRYYSRVKYGWAMRGYITEAANLAKTANDNKVGELATYMSDHFHNTVLDTKGDFGQLRGAIFLWVFGGSVAGATTNLTQIPMITLPWMAAKFGGIGKGDVKASAAILKAMVQIENFYKKGAYSNHTSFQMRAIDYGVRTGRISETQAADLAGMAQGQTLLGASNNKFRRGVQWLLEKSTWMFEITEQYNRRVTFRAALELAQSNPNSKAVSEAMLKYGDEYNQLVQSGWAPAEARATITAVHATEQTQFVYARENRPAFMRNRTSALIFTFQNYYINVLQLMGANKGSVMPRQLLILLLVGGLYGLPGAEDLEDIANLLGKHFFGKDFNVKRQAREFLVELVGDKADVILHGMARRGWGLPALMDLIGDGTSRGLGAGPAANLPVPVFDRSKAVSMGRLLPVNLGVLGDPTDVNKAIAAETQNAAGAVFGVGFNLYRAAFDRSTDMDDFKRWEKAMPRALASASRGWRAYNEGRERGRGGPNTAPTIVPYDVRDTEQLSEVIGMALGYTPLRQAAKWDEIMMYTEVRAKLQIEQKLVIQNRYEAIRGGVEHEMEAARKRMEDYNNSLPDWANGYTITFDTLERSFEARDRDRMAKEAGVPIQHRDRSVAEYIQRLFPESVVDVRKVR